jgi:hypothetical protein
VYSVPCECGQIYIEQTGRSIDTEGQGAPIRLEHPDKSAVAEHSINLGHRIQLQDITILSTKSRYMDRMIRETTEIELHPNCMNMKADLRLSRSWKPLIYSPKGRRKHPISHCQSRPGH